MEAITASGVGTGVGVGIGAGVGAGVGSGSFVGAGVGSGVGVGSLPWVSASGRDSSTGPITSVESEFNFIRTFLLLLLTEID